MKKVLTFGECLIRLQSNIPTFFSKEIPQLITYPGGSEANVAVALAQLGIPTSYCTALPENKISNEILENLKNQKVDVSKIKIQGDRIGQYFLLSANGLTNGDVIYDRKYSSFYNLLIDDFDFDDFFDDVDWFHWTAITPALSPNLGKICKILLEEAEKRNIIISVDLNYRSKLWQYNVEPTTIMPSLVNHCDVIMGNIWAENKMLNTSIDLDLNRSTSKEDYIKYSTKVANEIFAEYSKCKHIANTFRFMDQPNHNLFYGVYHTNTTTTYSSTFETHEVIDRIGSGDAFMGGLIFALINEMNPQEIIDNATNYGFEKLFVPGDFSNIKQKKS